MPRGESFEIIPPQENIAESRTDKKGIKCNLEIADKNPDNKSAWITDKSGSRTSNIFTGEGSYEAANEEYNRIENGEAENND